MTTCLRTTCNNKTIIGAKSNLTITAGIKIRHRWIKILKINDIKIKDIRTKVQLLFILNSKAPIILQAYKLSKWLVVMS